MRILFRLWVVWAVLWIGAIGFGDGFSEANSKALLLLLGGPLAVVVVLCWVIRGGQRSAPRAD